MADPKGATVSASYRTFTVGGSAIVQRDRSFYAFPVAEPGAVLGTAVRGIPRAARRAVLASPDTE
ncbi:hypothetical protein SMICM17S_10948 [Streptomyces microflavus]